MRLRACCASILTIGFGLFLVATVIALGTDDSQLARDRGTSELVPSSLESFEPVPQVTFSPVSTVSLPIISSDYCSPLYYDDFSDPTSGWDIEDTGLYQLEYLDGEYRIAINGPGYRMIVAPEFWAAEYTATVQVRTLQPFDNGPFGLVFGLAENGSQFYSFRINDIHVYALSVHDGDTITDLAWDFSSYIQSYPGTNKLTVERIGSRIRAYINDSLVADVFDSTYAGSLRVGVTAESGNEADARFDDFTVRSPTCGSPAVGATKGNNPSGVWLQRAP